MTKTGIARIQVQNNFCSRCTRSLKDELLKINDITNVYLLPNESLVIFNFIRANQLSTALNLLTSLGYPPKGDRIDKNQFCKSACLC